MNLKEFSELARKCPACGANTYVQVNYNSKGPILESGINVVKSTIIHLYNTNPNKIIWSLKTPTEVTLGWDNSLCYMDTIDTVSLMPDFSDYQIHISLNVICTSEKSCLKIHSNDYISLADMKFKNDFSIINTELTDGFSYLHQTIALCNYNSKDTTTVTVRTPKPDSEAFSYETHLFHTFEIPKIDLLTLNPEKFQKLKKRIMNLRVMI